MITVESTSTRPVLLLGRRSPVLGEIRAILVAAGYRVVTASEPEESLRLASSSRPRVVAVALDADGEWDRILHPLASLPGEAPVVLIEEEPDGPSSPRCREPSFARQLLVEIQYAERPRFTRARGATR